MGHRSKQPSAWEPSRTFLGWCAHPSLSPSSLVFSAWEDAYSHFQTKLSQQKGLASRSPGIVFRNHGKHKVPAVDQVAPVPLDVPGVSAATCPDSLPSQSLTSDHHPSLLTLSPTVISQICLLSDTVTPCRPSSPHPWAIAPPTSRPASSQPCYHLSVTPCPLQEQIQNAPLGIWSPLLNRVCH